MRAESESECLEFNLAEHIIIVNQHHSIFIVSDLFDGVLDNTCVCPMACDVVSYETTVSTASFPNPSMIKILRNRGYNRTKDYFRYVTADGSEGRASDYTHGRF